jgi:DUF3040 family protein
VTLSVREQQVLGEISRQVAAEDPAYHRRLARFGGYETSALGLPGRWAAFPAALIGIVLVAMIALFVAVGTPGSGHDAPRATHSAAR